MSEMTPQHPAAPETETDANGLRELLAAATPGPWQHFGDHLVWPSERGPAANDPIAGVSEEHQECAALIVAAVNALPALLADLDAARERVRVVEGERDAARGDLVFSRQTTTNVMEALADSGAETLVAIARAESAEAAHEAEKAAHERLRAEGAAWIADSIGYPVEVKMPDHPMPQALWDALVDHVHADATGKWHGNTLDREDTESWLADEAGPSLLGGGEAR